MPQALHGARGGPWRSRGEGNPVRTLCSGARTGVSLAAHANMRSLPNPGYGKSHLAPPEPPPEWPCEGELKGWETDPPRLIRCWGWAGAHCNLISYLPSASSASSLRLKGELGARNGPSAPPRPQVCGDPEKHQKAPCQPARAGAGAQITGGYFCLFWQQGYLCF